MKIKSYYICAVLLMLCVSMPALAQDAQADKLIGWWLFDSQKEETGNWSDIALHGAELKDGQLIVETGKWAHALEYSGPNIVEKTLMTWVALDNLAATKGSALTLDKVSEDQFNGMVYAERQPNQWMSGSSWFRRTNDFPKAHNENKEGEMVYLAFTYEVKGGTYQITGYRNGVSLGSYEKGKIKTWRTGDAEAIWGKRHTNGLGGPGDLNAHIEESRIYAVALTEAEINEMQIGTISVYPDVTRLTPRPEDINEDGVVNIQDLVLVASNFGKTDNNSADVNKDGTVNIIDLSLIAAAFDKDAAAASIWHRDLDITSIRADLQQWLWEARRVNLTDPSFERGILVLEHLLVALTPKKTVLLPNYPNPFNPETWIPYQLAKPGDVTLHIYAVDGTVVRTLSLGHQLTGIYQDKKRAAYWDGRNTLGERVASGVYFYQLQAGNVSPMRKMLILK